jgi:DNA polymerase-3 subunit delta'
VSSEPEALLDTVRSRCQRVEFAALGAEALESALAEREPAIPELERRAVARLAAGDLSQALFLVSAEGRELRAGAEACVRAARQGKLERAPWSAVLVAADAAGKKAGEDVRGVASDRAAEAGETEGPAGRRRSREAEESARRATRRARTQAIDLALGLIAAWLRDLAACADGAADLMLAADRRDELAADAEGVDGRRARQAGELVMDTRRRLTVNVSEELALEALLYRVEYLLTKR